MKGKKKGMKYIVRRKYEEIKGKGAREREGRQDGEI